METLPSHWIDSIDAHCARLRARACSPTTIAGRRRHLVLAAAWFGVQGHRTPSAITTRDLEAYGAQLGGPQPHRTPATCRNHLTAIRIYFRELHQYGAIATDPAAQLQLPPAIRGLPRAILDSRDLKAVRTAAFTGRCHRVRNRAIVETLYATGIRRAECAALAIGDIDHHRETVFVRRGKGRRQRAIPIAPLALRWIAAYLRREQRLARRSLEAAQPLFTRPDGSPLSPSHLSDLVRSILRRAGIAKPGACHMFRHSMATHMLDNGADIRFIQAMLGHADISTTMIYTQVSNRGLAEVYRRSHPSCTIEQRLK